VLDHDAEDVAHKFLGLTREILRSESSLNTLVSHPLPTSFYTGGGMQALRERFQPADHRGDETFPSQRSSAGETNDSVTSRDYFNFEPASPTVKAPSLPSFTPHATTPAATSSVHRNVTDTFGMTKINQETSRSVPTVGPSTSSAMSPDTAVRHSSKFVRRASAIRKQVAAGDLAMSSAGGRDDNGGAYYRPSARTPGIPRMDTWRGTLSSSVNEMSLHDHGGVHVEDPDVDDDGVDTFELRDAVLQCIARSIGLSQPIPESNVDTSHAPSVSAFSTPNSPLFPPNRPSSRSPFGNVLDMMNASTHNENLIGGMLREAVNNARFGEGDEVSSVSASMQESGLGGTGLQDGRDVLRDLEGNVEILYYKKGSVLVREGEKSPGIYYVIDGFLEVSQYGSTRLTRPSGLDTDTREWARFDSPGRHEERSEG
jgi:lysophospholipid hydrolase